MNEPKQTMAGLLRCMAENDASDLHLSMGVPPFMRINGMIVPIQYPPLTRDDCEGLIFSLLSGEGKNAYEQLKTLDFAYGDPSLGRFRINIYQQQGTVAAAIRRLPLQVPSIDELGLPVPPVQRLCEQSHGLVLVCGPVGSGKTTTMSAMVNYINNTRSAHIITIEDPVEYVHTNIKCLIHQREVRRDTPDFLSALKFILREDPDIVVIGEMRDIETIYSALAIAETGHLVMATLHTGDTGESIRRIVDSFPSSQQSQIHAQLSYCIRGVINQVLLPKIDGSGRVLATEIMVGTPAVQSLIREGKIEQLYSHIQMGSQFGMQTMNQSLSSLCHMGLVAPECALARTRLVQELTKMLEN